MSSNIKVSLLDHIKKPICLILILFLNYLLLDIDVSFILVPLQPASLVFRFISESKEISLQNRLTSGMQNPSAKQ